jgi:hypothetical protein
MWFRILPGGKIVISGLILFPLLWRGRAWRHGYRRRVQRFRFPGRGGPWPRRRREWLCCPAMWFSPLAGASSGISRRSLRLAVDVVGRRCSPGTILQATPYAEHAQVAYPAQPLLFHPVLNLSSTPILQIF